MKKQKVGIMIATIAIVGFGSLFFSQSSNWVMASMQEKLSSQKEVVVTNEVDTKEELAIQEEKMKAERELQQQLRELQQELELNEHLRLDKVGTMHLLYCGQLVYVDDSLVEKDVAEENGMKVMDFIYENLSKEILMQYNVDTTKYIYSMQRNYEKPNDTIYSVSLILNDRIVCDIEISLDDEPFVIAFGGSKNADVYGENRHIANEGILGNEYIGRENHEFLYQEYYNYSKNLIENVMGLSSINERNRDVDQNMDVTVDEMQNIVTFGYQLEDGSYVKMSYNMINKTLERFEVVED